MPKRPFSIMTPPLIRDAAPADAAALATLMAELGYPVTPDVLWARIDCMASPSHRTFVAEIEGRLAGFVGCSALTTYESDVPTCWIMALVVASRFRRHGIGRALIEAVEQWCVARALPDIRIHGGDTRNDAHLFYDACGFQRAGIRFKRILPAPPANSADAARHPAA